MMSYLDIINEPYSMFRTLMFFSVFHYIDVMTYDVSCFGVLLLAQLLHLCPNALHSDVLTRISVLHCNLMH